MLDLIIKNGEIVDGTGAKAYRGDVGIKDGLICKISSKITELGKEVIDASGDVICPGFIDIHSHSDFTITINPMGESKIRQGITTEVIGNCGFTIGPMVPERYEELMQYLVNTVVLKETDKRNWNWKKQCDYIEFLASKGMPFNIVSLVGHGTIRVGVLGFEKRKPTTKELSKMLIMLESELLGGIHGMSTGLQYDPGSFSDIEELIEMAKLLAAYEGIYTTHLKSEGKNLLDCLRDAIHIGQLSKVSVQISHLKAENPQNWGKVKEALCLIDAARNKGVNIDFDVYPYTAFGSGLIDLIPPWAREEGLKKMLEIIRNDKKRNQVIQDMNSFTEDWDNPMMGCDWDKVQIASVRTCKNKVYEGLTIKQIATKNKCTPHEVVLGLLEEEKGAVKIISFAMCHDDLETIMKHPRAIFCTDGRAVAPYGELSSGKTHPRYYGTYPRILGHYVRTLQLMALEEAIKKMTLLPALKMNINNRGQMKEGYFADIVIFNKEEILDLATYDEPHRYPKGVYHVLVNGKPVIYKGEHTGNLPGKVLKRINQTL